MFGAIIRNVVATAMSFVGAKLWTKFLSDLVHNDRLDPHSARKIMHVTTCPLFTLTWPLFDPSTSIQSRIFAACVPLTFALRILQNPSGDKLVVAVARSSAEEGGGMDADIFHHAKGPFYYAVSSGLITLIGWTSTPATYIAFSAMCFGDGMAGTIGRLIKSPDITSRLHPRVLFAKKKTLAGSISLFVFTVLSSSVWLSGTAPSWLVLNRAKLDRKVFETICKTSMICAFVELLSLEDNLSVPLSALGISSILLKHS